MEQVRELLSKESSVEQLQNELISLGKADRQLRALGQGNAVFIPAEDILAMKADLSITWSKLRTLRRYSLYFSTIFHTIQMDESLARKLCL